MQEGVKAGVEATERGKQAGCEHGYTSGVDRLWRLVLNLHEREGERERETETERGKSR